MQANSSDNPGVSELNNTPLDVNPQTSTGDTTVLVI